MMRRGAYLFSARLRAPSHVLVVDRAQHDANAEVNKAHRRHEQPKPYLGYEQQRAYRQQGKADHYPGCNGLSSHLPRSIDPPLTLTNPHIADIIAVMKESAKLGDLLIAAAALLSGNRIALMSDGSG